LTGTNDLAYSGVSTTAKIVTYNWQQDNAERFEYLLKLEE